MPKPNVMIGEESRVGMLDGFETMGHLLSITLGPVGGNIANAREPDGPDGQVGVTFDVLLGDGVEIALREGQNRD